MRRRRERRAKGCSFPCEPHVYFTDTPVILSCVNNDVTLRDGVLLKRKMILHITRAISTEENFDSVRLNNHHTGTDGSGGSFAASAATVSARLFGGNHNGKRPRHTSRRFRAPRRSRACHRSLGQCLEQAAGVGQLVRLQRLCTPQSSCSPKLQVAPKKSSCRCTVGKVARRRVGASIRR